MVTFFLKPLRIASILYCIISFWNPSPPLSPPYIISQKFGQHFIWIALHMGRHSCCYKQKLRKGLWSPEEDEKLIKHITKYGHGCWSSVPKFAGKFLRIYFGILFIFYFWVTSVICEVLVYDIYKREIRFCPRNLFYPISRYFCSCSGVWEKWTLLLVFVSYIFVMNIEGLQRCGKSCRLRWINYLRPDLKRGTFSQEEEGLIIELHAVLGNRYIFLCTNIWLIIF